MSTTETQQNSPAAEPRRDTDDRLITASWPVGPRAESGEQKRATLKVMHHKGTGYTAVLGTMHETIGDIFVTQRLNLSFSRREVTIATLPAARFSRKGFEEFYTTALAKLRGRYQSDDEAVTTYFDPDSPVFDYA
ncbi:hypothetical protein [Nocardia amamiensis]|uniref:hypothetical protein n=1 Tax=Nocardia amamiensis TaxID=404578 RepID=UPI000833E5F4|nr:hypothetical protein [Nocardia amamiensis]